MRSRGGGGCRTVWDAELADGPDIVIAPYFYAGEGEISWVRESLLCSRVFKEFATSIDDPPIVWTSILVHANWLADDAARDQLLTALTGQPMEALHLLVHTNQPSFGPLADLAVLRGFRDLFEVMRDAGVPVVVGKRASSGLLLLALGRDGWSSGIAANLMNGAAHPESNIDGGRALDRIYVPSLMNLITLPTFTLMRQADPGLGTDEAQQLLDENPDLDPLTTEERILLLQHNLKAQRRQVDQLSAMPAGQRISLLRTWVSDAMVSYRRLPPTRLDSEGPAFLSAWESALN